MGLLHKVIKKRGEKINKSIKKNKKTIAIYPTFTLA